jgi:hypothetical protein
MPDLLKEAVNEPLASFIYILPYVFNPLILLKSFKIQPYGAEVNIILINLLEESILERRRQE